ncbi:DUF1707 SHOCT-like domain-containing protein [Saccharomonospora xinjiangensis]|uniref:DUF1707 domain-containing protein n=1 Tax=Saccharomonospora xinjiangensis XJ-54 TaxID=882086 RepID=I0V0L3_9PSEU|nr:DUF1707 domain-containing protein [Saccharomonospora xinjiangensis]EID53666.1 protein of unknown function (DUF1707) [Saccharomonospora xinjiangensis XJ-54]
MAVDRPNFRLSDAERTQALDALAEHVRTGRLDLPEYDERSASVTSAKTRGDLAAVFADLPDPRPEVLGPAGTVERVPAAVPVPSLGRRLAAVAVPAATVLAVVLFFTLGRFGIFVFVLPIVVALLAGSLARQRH